MGNSYAYPATTFDVSGVHLLMDPDSFMIKRTSGEWEEHMLSLNPEKWGAYRDSHEIGKKVPAATKTFRGKYGPQTTEWRIFMCKGFPDTEDGVSGWRSLDNIRPSIMTEDEAVKWRKEVEAKLEELTKTVEDF